MHHKRMAAVQIDIMGSENWWMLQIVDLWKQINQQSLQNVKKLIHKLVKCFASKMRNITEQHYWPSKNI
jgi:hypothetical protein